MFFLLLLLISTLLSILHDSFKLFSVTNKKNFMIEGSTLNEYISTAKALIQTENKDYIYSIAFALFEKDKDNEKELLLKDNEKEKELMLKDKEIAQQKAFFLKQISFVTQR
jgi:hypothetical protein